MNWLCKRGFHKFRARYTEHESNPKGDISYKGRDNPRRLLFYEEYICDICERCGEKR